MQHHAGDFNHLECNLRPKYLDMKEATAEQNSAQYTNLITLPHIVPFMSLFEHISQKPIFESFYQDQSKLKTLDHKKVGIAEGYFHEHEIQKYFANSEKMMSNVMLDDTLLDLFRTEYHIRLHWGSQSRFILQYPENSDERHEEFEKVVTTLFEMCSMSHNIYNV